MKKLFTALLILLMQPAGQVLALNPEKTINLHSDSIYILNVDKRPQDIQVTNPRILEATTTSDIFSQSGQIVLTTQEEGISYVSYKQGKITCTIKVLIDNNEDVDESVIELDTIKDIEKDK